MFGTRHCRHWSKKSAAHIYGMTKKDRLNDIFLADSETYAHLRAFDPELPDHVWAVIIRYQPRLSSVQWEAVREFTISNAVRMKPRTFEAVRRLMTMSARFNAWVWASMGTTLTVERVYTQNHVYRYLQERLPKHSQAHRWGLVRQLGTIAAALASAHVKPLPSLHRRPSRRPFTSAEVASMHSWAASLTTVLKRQNAQALLGLAGGAGLRTDEIIDTRIGDVDVVDGRVFVNVPGSRPRRVPVRNPWNRTLMRSLAGRANPDEYIFRAYRLDEYRPRAIQTFLTDHPAQVRATVSRLRSTWIVAQIDNGLPLPVLMAIAGISASSGLDKHLVHARHLNVADYVGLIIGEEVAR
jgi:integrase